MRNTVTKTVAATAATGLALGALALAGPAAAAPSGAGTAQQTIKQLEDEGYRVILSRVGSGSINDCNVKAVRPGRDITELKAAPRGNTEERVRYTTVYVDLACGQGK
ncbi:hypothetical protein ACNQR7_14675 [Mycolicibacterium senegalense]|uniref:hypothetical protein n=1 Tax=Mycolicibacterium TaxID=1866885 RepID=UPI003204CA96